MLKKFKDLLYGFLVESNADVRYFHQSYASAMKSGGSYSRVKSLLYLMKLTLLIRILRLKKYKKSKNKTYSKPYCAGAESGLSYSSPGEFAEGLLGFDVVSFDVFDTLLHRPFDRPKDLFHIVGQKLEYPDFADIRARAEYEARKQEKSGEIDIYDIYGYLEKYCGIDAKTGVAAEFETELELLHANAFIKKVYDILAGKNKKIIALTDMYLPCAMIKKILDNCGYNGISEIFVSCEYKKSKRCGDLFEAVREKTGKTLKYIHIGDNPQSDYERAKKQGFAAARYENVNQKGAKYRACDMSAIVGAAWRGVVNAHFHTGLNKYTMAYEYGFMCGGLFVLGYCEYIYKYVQARGIEKILFLSRDGEILKKVYDGLFPGNNSEYVFWSRKAAAKLGSDKFRFDFFRRFILHKTNTNTPISNIFKGMDLTGLLPGFESTRNIPAASALDSKNAETVIEYLIENWGGVQKAYARENENAKNYYAGVVGGCKKICTVDIGWAGSGGVILAYLIKDIWKLNCRSYTVLAGTNSANNAEPDMSEGFLQSGEMTAYMYSQSHNRDIYRFHDPGEMHNIFFEFILSSKSPGFKGFCGTGPAFEEKDSRNDAVTEEIHAGILDFIDIYKRRFKAYDFMFNISGADAYAPFRHLAADKNKYFKKLFENIYFDVGVGDDKKTKIF